MNELPETDSPENDSPEAGSGEAPDRPSECRSTMRQSLRRPMFRRLLAALAVSQAGDWLYNVALLAFVYERTHSAAWVAATTATRVVPIVVLGPLGGVVADRFDRRRVMIAADVVRAAVMLLLAATAAAHLPVVLAPLLAACATVASTPYPPCVAVTMPRLVPRAELAGANAARSAVSSLCIVGGPAIGGALLLVTSSTTAFVLNALTFIASAVLVLRLPRAALRAERDAGAAASGEMPRILADLAEGCRALRSSADALRLVGADISCSVVYGAQTVLLLLLSRALGYGANGYGWMLAGMGLGGVIGTTLASRAADVRRPQGVLAAALLAVGGSLPLLTIASSLGTAVALSVVGGAGAIIVEVMTETGLQRSLDERVLGRAYGLALPAALAGIVVGSLVAAPLVSLLGLHRTFVVLGTTVAAYAVSLLRPPTTTPRPASISSQPAS